LKPGSVAAVFLSAASMLWHESARSSEPCGVVVSYFMDPYQGSGMTNHEWRVFSPSRGTDELFLACPSGFDRVRWDTTYSWAFFNSRDSLYKVEWRMGASPKLIAKLPEVHDLEDWWFNPDSSCWQVAAMRPIGPAQTASRYWCELWQSSTDVSEWHRVRADTVGCEAEDCGTWPWYDAPFARRTPSMTLQDLGRDATADAWRDRIVPFDTTKVAISDSQDSEWRYLASGAAPQRGLAFRFMESNETVVSGPIYFVDLDHRTRRRLPLQPSDEAGWFECLVSERCGLLLVPGSAWNPLVVDGRTGRTVFTRPWNVHWAAWVHQPR
jgi:hypothetical protein